MEPTLKKLLSEVLRQPTAPFRETWTRAKFLHTCLEHSLKHWLDPIGNLWLGVENLSEAKRTELLLVAHLDHPGFVVNRFFEKKTKHRTRRYAEAQWLGGGPMEIRNFGVTIFSDFHAGVKFGGTIVEAEKAKRSIGRALIELEDSPERNPMISSIVAAPKQSLRDLGPWGACLNYKECPDGVKFSNGECITKAADDLVGACAITAAFLDSNPARRVAACLTRAEEAGFHGALEILNKKWLNPTRTKMISIETSAWRAGAELGKGPVVRQGDRVSLFDHSLVEQIESMAIALKKKNKDFTYQKRVMDGGACEASAFRVFGFEVAGVSTPLGNYHNIDPHLRAKPEIVRTNDVEGLYWLLCEIIENFSNAQFQRLKAKPLAQFGKEILRNHRAHTKFF